MDWAMLMIWPLLWLNTWAEARIDMCSSGITTASSQTLTHASFPEPEVLQSCQCNLTSMGEDVDVEFTTSLQATNQQYVCEPNIAYKNFESRFLLHGCPGPDSNTVIIRLKQNHTLSISIVNVQDEEAKFSATFEVLESVPVEVTCSPGLPGFVLPAVLSQNAPPQDTPLETGHNDGAILAVVFIVVILLFIFVAAYIKVRVRDYRRNKQRDRAKLEEVSQATATTTGPEDNIGFEPTPKSSTYDLSKDAVNGQYASSTYNRPRVMRQHEVEPPPPTFNNEPNYSSPYSSNRPGQFDTPVTRYPTEDVPYARPSNIEPIMEPLHAHAPSGMARAPSQQSIPGNMARAPSQQSIPGNMARAPSQQSIPGNMARAPSQQSIPSFINKAPSVSSIPDLNDPHPERINRAPSQQSIPSSMNRAPSQQSIPSGMNRAPSQQSIPSSMNRAPSQQSIPSSMNRAPSQQSIPSVVNRAPSQASIPEAVAALPGDVKRAPSQNSIPQLLYPYPSPPDSPVSSHEGSINSSAFGNPAQRLAEYYTPPESTPNIRQPRASSMSPYKTPYSAKYSASPDGETTV